jgi:hypothetical protein
MSRFKGTPFLSQAQRERVHQVHEDLCKLHGEASAQLLKVGNSWGTNKDYSAAGASFGILATRMNFLMQWRERIIFAERQPSRIRVSFVTTCGNRDDPIDGPQSISGPQGEGANCLCLDPEDLNTLDSLIDLAYRTEERVASRWTCPKKFFDGITRLKRALLSQEKTFNETAPEECSDIDVEYRPSGVCDVCGKSIVEPREQTNEEPNRERAQ